MKRMKRAAFAAAAVLMSGAMGAMLCGCSFSSLFGGVEPPEITSVANVLHWEAVEDAVSYHVYAGEQLVGTTESTFFVLSGLNSDSDVTVKSVSKKDKESKPSNAVQVQKTASFTAAETMEIALEDDKEYSVPADIRYVKVTGSGTSAGVTIQNSRVNDIVIELQDVTMLSGKENNCFRSENNVLDAAELKYNVIFVIKGNNSLTGASQTETPPAQTQVNSGKSGTDGYSGRTPIVLPTVIMTGDGSLILKGGDGGPGGVGAPSKGFSADGFGGGGDGGSGGGGIKCTTLIMAMESGTRVTASGGKGGKGGNAGDNGNLLTGPFASLFGVWQAACGDYGADGKPLTGELIEYSGGFVQ